jgi:DNA-binding transcriptional MerR regulator
MSPPETTTYRTAEVLERLGVEKGFVRYWTERLKLEPARAADGFRYSQADVDKLALAKQLSQLDGRSQDTVRRVIGERFPSAAPASDTGAAPELRESSTEAAPVTEDAARLIVAAIERLAAEARPAAAGDVAAAVVAELAPQLTGAARAQQEALNAALRELADERKKVDGLQAHLVDASHRLGLVQGELAATRAQLNAAQLQLAAPRARVPFWRRLLGGG